MSHCKFKNPHALWIMLTKPISTMDTMETSRVSADVPIPITTRNKNILIADFRDHTKQIIIEGILDLVI